MTKYIVDYRSKSTLDGFAIHMVTVEQGKNNLVRLTFWRMGFSIITDHNVPTEEFASFKDELLAVDKAIRVIKLHESELQPFFVATMKDIYGADGIVTIKLADEPFD